MAGKRNNQIVTEYLGIHSTRKTVENVSHWQDGSLTKSRSDGGTYRHPYAGSNVESEIFIVFQLTDLFSYPVQMWDAAWVKQKRGELEARAAAMRAEASDS